MIYFTKNGKQKSQTTKTKKTNLLAAKKIHLFNKPVLINFFAYKACFECCGSAKMQKYLIISMVYVHHFVWFNVILKHTYTTNSNKKRSLNEKYSKHPTSRLRTERTYILFDRCSFAELFSFAHYFSFS